MNSALHAQRVESGWKDSRGRWTCKLGPERMLMASGEAVHAIDEAKEGVGK